MTDLSPQQVSNALHNLIAQEPRATHEGVETQSYLHMPYRAADEAVLQKVLPHLIGAQDDVSFDMQRHMVHFTFATPEGYDTPAPQDVGDVQARIDYLANNPEAFKRALKQAKRDPGDDEGPVPHGARRREEFFATLRNAAENPQLLVDKASGKQNSEAAFEACRQQMYDNRDPSQPWTIADNSNAYTVCHARHKGGEGPQR